MSEDSRSMKRTVHTLPEDDATCGWLATAPPAAAAVHLPGDLRADCAIVGAGFTGLAIAKRLHELRPDWRIVLLDAQRAGDGASGRCSGFVVNLVDFATTFSPEDRKRSVVVSVLGIELLKAEMERCGFDCDWDEGGFLRGAAGEKGLATLEGWPGWLSEVDIGYERLGPEEMAAATGTDFYQGGVRVEGSVLAHPGKLVRGLIAGLPEAIELYEETPVTALARTAAEGGRFELTTPRGTVRADRLFLAANGYLASLGYLRREVVPLYTFGSHTRVLTADEQEALGGDREWGLLALDPMGSSVRRTRDQRILIRNSVHFTKALAVDAKKREWAERHHRTAFETRFPALRHVAFEYTWSGLMGTSPNYQHWFGEAEDGLYLCGGYSGAGISLGTGSGRLLADLALGEDSPELDAVLGLPGPRVLPPDPMRSLGAKWIAFRMNSRAGAYL